MKLFKWRKIAFLSVSGALAFTANNTWAEESLSDVMKHRGLTERDVLAAAETYLPTGKQDEYIVFSSGGQSGQVIVYGIPSMRLLKYIAVFTPEPWQGYGFDEASKAVLAQGRIQGKDITFGDTHHPALSETNGRYDGEYLFINDKANPRVAVIDLHDFKTKQIVVNPVFKSSHGGTFVSENTEYVIEAAQYPTPYENAYVPLEQFNERYRGGMTYWHFDRKKGRIIPEQSFTVMAPPYSQDLSDFGKGPSSGWSFTNSFCTERYVGGIMRGKPPFEAGCSAKDTDFLHVVNWRKAAQLVKEGKATKINGHDVITIDTAVKEGILYLVPEPKSPHGMDVSPDGKYMIVSGKLDSHTSVYSFEKIQKAIADGKFEGKDPYGIPIIAMKDALHKQVPLGLGPLHTQYDAKTCVAYTSLYVDSMVAKWDYCRGKVLDKISIHYNIGHLMTMQGDSMNPEGKYLVALNKLAIDRFNPVGPLHPQNHQLIDISGDKMQLLYDMPLPLGEPHYAVAINATTGAGKAADFFRRASFEQPIRKDVDHKADYEKLAKANQAQQATLNKEIGIILGLKYYDFPKIAALVVNALDELNVAKKAEREAKAAASSGDWENAKSAAEKWQMAQNKAAGIASKARNAWQMAQDQASPTHEHGQRPELPGPVITGLDGAAIFKDKNCYVCHGKDGKTPLAPSYPNIAGQGYAYTFTQMKDIKRDERHNLAMREALGSVNKSEMLAIAQWLASLPSNKGMPVSDATLAAKGEKLYKSNDTNCAGCHGADGKTPLRPDHFPKLAGQSKDYIIAQLKNLKNGERHNGNSAAMNGIMQDVSYEDMVAIAEWLASLEGAPAGEKPTVIVTMLPTDGASLYKRKNCHTCHGDDGNTPLIPDYPNLGGQGQAYAFAQMIDIMSDARHNVAMKGALESVSKEEMRILAQWMATLPGSKGVAGDPTLMAKGETLYKDNETNCIGCHGADANTPLRPDHFPKLAGQSKSYIIAQLKNIKSGERSNSNSAAMKGIMQGESDEDIAAVAEWLASLKGPAGKPTPKAPEVLTPPSGETSDAGGKAVPEEPSTTDVVAMKDAEGKTLYQSKGCIACHGADGKKPLTPTYPKLAGQNPDYATTQMKDIKNGARHNGQSLAMKGVMPMVNDEEMKTIAEWLNSLPRERGTASNATLIAKGAALYQSKTCVACHGKDAQTPVMPAYPKLSGQNPAYALAQMKDIKSGVRDNGQTAAMKTVMFMVSDEEMAAIAEWLASVDVAKQPEKSNVDEVATASDGETETALKLAPNLENGLEVYEVCSACHLPEGWGKKEGTFPQLAGQHRTVLIKQMSDIRAKNRDNPTMYPFALPEEIGDAQALADVTAYISKLPMNPDNGVGAGDDLGHGENLFKDNCVKCHGDEGEGNAEKFYPRIQGQHYKYLLRQIEWIRDGKRRNANLDMVKQIKGFTNRDMKAVIDYVSRLKPPKEDLADDPNWENPDFAD